MNAPFQPSPQPRAIEYPPRSLAEMREREPDLPLWASIEFAFLTRLFIASDARRMKAGPDGLMHDGSRLWIALAMRDYAKARWDHGALLLWNMASAAHLVAELEAEMADSAKLKAEAVDALKRFRDLVWRDGHALKGNQYLLSEWEDEDAFRTTIRTLDFIEHMKQTEEYAKIVDLRRFCCSCLRVTNAVFGTNY